MTGNIKIDEGSLLKMATVEITVNRTTKYKALTTVGLFVVKVGLLICGFGTVEIK